MDDCLVLLADLIRNFGDAATAILLGAAVLMRSERAERYTGHFVVFAVSLAVVARAITVSVGLSLADPLIGLGISVLIMRATWQSWRTVRDGHAHTHSHQSRG